MPRPTLASQWNNQHSPRLPCTHILRVVSALTGTAPRLALERLSFSFGVTFGLQGQLNVRTAQMTPKASVDPLALYFQSHCMSLNHPPSNWSLQQVKTAESAALGEASYGKNCFRTAKFSSNSMAQKAEGMQITYKEQAGRHWRSLYNLWGEQRACKPHRKVKSIVAVGINANGYPGKAYFCTKSQIRSDVICSLCRGQNTGLAVSTD